LAREMVMWSPSQIGGFPLGLVSFHMKTTQMQTSVPTSMIITSCTTCLVIVK